MYRLATVHSVTDRQTDRHSHASGKWFAAGCDEVLCDVRTDLPGIHGRHVQSILVL